MNKIYFFNAANFNFAEIDLRKRNIFFVGDNGSGKTTAIRAIHFYYNSDVKALGIDPNKDSFKEFYFKYDNSFIVYEFDDYFVLMYKNRGDIKRVFSKQKFDVNRVIENNQIKPLKDVIAYANEASLRYRPATNDEFRKIVYGLNSKLLDFKLTTIRNYQTFINLYNKIFNVNKAVFDAKSIKEIIFTTLDRVEVGEINYEEFANELIEYRHYFIFYRKFKEKSSEIEKLYIYKNMLLRLKEEMETLLEKIAYKKDIELKQKNEIIDILKSLENKKRVVLKQFGYFDKKIKRVEKEIESKIFELESNLNEIEKLKEYFSTEKLQEARNKIIQKDEINKKIITLQTSLNELIKGIKNQAEEIEEEIERIKREIRILKDKQKEEEFRLKRDLEERYFELIEKLKEDIEKKEKLKNQKIEEIISEIEKIKKEKNYYVNEMREVEERFEKEKEKIIKEYKKRVGEIKEIIKKEELNKEELVDEVYKLKRELKKIKNEYDERLQEINLDYQKEIKIIDEKIEFYKNILKTKPNSFKEFLNQNVENWEEELYPVIEEKILNMDIDELRPRVVSERILGIELDKTKLKTIPTMKEAEEEIEKLEKLRKNVNEEFEKKLEIIKKEFLAKEIEIDSKREVFEEKIKEIETKREVLDEEIKKLNSDLDEEIKKLDNLKEEEIKLIKANINKKELEIKNFSSEIEKIKREIKSLKKEFNEKKNELIRKKDNEFKNKIKDLNKKYEKLKKELEEKIETLKKRKNSISKDERIQELNVEIEKLNKKLKEIEKAELFIREYEAKREFILSENELKKELEKFVDYKNRIEKFFNKMDKKLNEKLENIEKEIIKNEKVLDRINSGLKKIEKIKLPENKKESNEFLDVLIDEYFLKESEFKEKKLEIKSLASDIKVALERFAIDGLDVGFNIELLGELNKEEFEKVDELYIFKDKKFDVLNKTRLKGLRNLINGILEKRIDNFEVAKEDFLNQIKKINSNLSKVDFGIIRDIKIEIEESKRDILKIFDEIKRAIGDLIVLLESSESLFFDKIESERKLRKIEELFGKIKKEIKEESFSLTDVIDINVKFIENEKENTLKVIKNESSTGGSILLKIAIAVSLLELFLKEKASLFLILDEVSVLSTKNQKLLKEFVNERGLGVIYVTPDLPLVDVDEIDIYKFRNIGGEFEVVRIIGEDGIKI